MYLKDWKSNTAGVLTPKWKVPYWVVLCTSTTVKLEGHSSWTHISRIKPEPSSQESSMQADMPSYSCEPVEGLKSLFK